MGWCAVLEKAARELGFANLNTVPLGNGFGNKPGICKVVAVLSAVAMAQLFL